MSTGKAGKHINFNWEMVKCNSYHFRNANLLIDTVGIYILFPVSSLYIYNSPQLHDSQVFKDQNVQIKNFRSDRDKLYKVINIRKSVEFFGLASSWFGNYQGAFRFV